MHNANISLSDKTFKKLIKGRCHSKLTTYAHVSIASGQYIIECFYSSQIYERTSNIRYHREKSINFNDITYRILKAIRMIFYMTQIY